MSIEAMKMALEALENIDRWLPTIGQKGLRDYEADAIQALRQAIDQAEKREPVAWMHNLIEGNVITHRPVDIDRHPERWTPLYTAPPKREWVGLTDEDKANFFTADQMTNEEWQQLYNAIEAKLKEKNS